MERNAKRIIISIGIAVIILSLSFYAYHQSKNYLRGPAIYVEEPKEGETFSTSLITIEGRAERISAITLNDRPIFVDENGGFREKLLLLPGYNIIKINAKDRFDRETKRVIEVVYKPK